MSSSMGGASDWVVARKSGDWFIRPKEAESENILQYAQDRDVRDIKFTPADEWFLYEEEGQDYLCREITWEVTTATGTEAKTFVYKTKMGPDSKEQAAQQCYMYCNVVKQMILKGSAFGADPTYEAAMSILKKGGDVSRTKDTAGQHFVFKIGTEKPLEVELRINPFEGFAGRKERRKAIREPVSLSGSVSMQQLMKDVSRMNLITVTWKPAGDEWETYTNDEGKTCLGRRVEWTFVNENGAEVRKQALIQTEMVIDLSNPEKVRTAMRRANLIYKVQMTALADMIRGVHGLDVGRHPSIREQFQRCIQEIRQGKKMKLDDTSYTPSLVIGSQKVYLSTLKTSNIAYASFEMQAKWERVAWESEVEKMHIRHEGTTIEVQSLAEIYAPSLPTSTDKKNISPSLLKIDIVALTKEGGQCNHEFGNVIKEEAHFSSEISRLTASNAADRAQAMQTVIATNIRFMQSYENLKVKQAEMKGLLESLQLHKSLTDDPGVKSEIGLLSAQTNTFGKTLEEWEYRYLEAKEMAVLDDPDEIMDVHEEFRELKELTGAPVVTKRDRAMLERLAKMKPGDMKAFTSWQREYKEEIAGAFNPRLLEMKQRIYSRKLQWNPDEVSLYQKLEERINMQGYRRGYVESALKDLEVVNPQSALDRITPAHWVKLVAFRTAVTEFIASLPQKGPSYDAHPTSYEVRRMLRQPLITKQHEVMLEDLRAIDTPSKVKAWIDANGEQVRAALSDSRFQDMKKQYGQKWNPDENLLHASLQKRGKGIPDVDVIQQKVEAERWDPNYSLHRAVEEQIERQRKYLEKIKEIAGIIKASLRESDPSRAAIEAFLDTLSP